MQKTNHPREGEQETKLAAFTVSVPVGADDGRAGLVRDRVLNAAEVHEEHPASGPAPLDHNILKRGGVGGGA